MRLWTIVPILSAVFIADSAMGQELELRDKVNLGVQADSGACLTPDGKKVLSASIAKDRQSIAYTLIGADGKDRKQVGKFNLGELKRCEYHNVLSGRGGYFSADGSMFLCHPDLDNEKNIELLGNPVVVALADGKAVCKGIPEQQVDSSLTFSGLLNIYGVFGKDNAVYYVMPDLPDNKTVSNSRSNRIMKHDPKTGLGASVAELGYIATRLICVSPDGTRLAGIVVDAEKYIGKKDSMKLWTYEIPTGRLEYSKPFAAWNETIPHVVWSLDNSTVYVASDAFEAGGLFAGRFFADPSQKELEEFRALAVQLGDTDFKVRDAAFSKLQAAGLKASAAIGEASRSDDAEIAARARMLQAETGVYVAALNRNNCESAVEVAPGWLCAKGSDSSIMQLIDAGTRKARPVLEKDRLVFIDLVGDIGLFRDSGRTLWTAKVVFSPAQAGPATSTGQTNPSWSD
ncbi:MAG: hypothetical protein HZA50_04550 [Planctomycetes bacterium]|nr:hypothetical protein [Planctomycetota bacterium]